MSKPMIHAKSSANKWGGVPEDYLDIHQLMDSSKGAVSDNRHRFLTHNSWFIQPNGVLESIFGVERTNSEGKKYSVRSVGEQHCIEDFGFIPTPQDYAMSMECASWMSGVGYAPSAKKLKISEKYRQYIKD